MYVEIFRLFFLRLELPTVHSFHRRELLTWERARQDYDT